MKVREILNELHGLDGIAGRILGNEIARKTGVNPYDWYLFGKGIKGAVDSHNRQDDFDRGHYHTSPKKSIKPIDKPKIKKPKPKRDWNRDNREPYDTREPHVDNREPYDTREPHVDNREPYDTRER